MTRDTSNEELEFDERHYAICRDHLSPGDEVTWYEVDARFDDLASAGTQVEKTLRRNTDGFTFLVKHGRRVLVVCTIQGFVKSKITRPNIAAIQSAAQAVVGGLAELEQISARLTQEDMWGLECADTVIYERLKFAISHFGERWAAEIDKLCDYVRRLENK